MYYSTLFLEMQGLFVGVSLFFAFRYDRYRQMQEKNVFRVLLFSANYAIMMPWFTASLNGDIHLREVTK
jgi:hypothetical protein